MNGPIFDEPEKIKALESKEAGERANNEHDGGEK